MEAERRRKALSECLGLDDLDAILITKLVNVRYLSGFTGSNAAILVGGDGGATLATDGRYDEQARREAPGMQVLDTRTLAADLVAAAGSAGVRRLGIERHHVTLAAFDAMNDVANGIQLVGLAEPVEQLRLRKDDDEIRALRAACQATDSAYAAVLPRLRPSITEREVAWLLLEAMRTAGAEDAAFASIVAFGPHSAVPHHQPTDRPLAMGDLVKLDFGATVNGYHADMTRTVVSGRAREWQRDLHSTVSDIQMRTRAETVVGAVPAELDARARALVDATGHRLVHGLGHGVGLEIHEAPFLVPGSSAGRLTARVAVTVEPGIYLPGQGGVRIEDTMLVTAGASESLTTSPRELLEV